MEQILGTTIDRRRFLQGAGLAVAGTAAVMLRPGGELLGLLDGLLHFRMVPAEELTRDLVERLSAATIAVELPAGDSVSLRVEEVTPLAAYASAGGAGGESFSLLMRGPGGTPIPQDTYVLWCREIGSFPLFVVPVGRPREDGSQQYEAVFNRLR